MDTVRRGFKETRKFKSREGHYNRKFKTKSKFICFLRSIKKILVLISIFFAVQPWESWASLAAKKKWVLGMLELGGTTRRPVLKIVRNRSRDVLLPIIQRHVRRRTNIISDEWRAYRGALTEAGYGGLWFSLNRCHLTTLTCG